MTASLSPRERLRLELAKDADQLVAVLKRALRSDNDQAALKAAVTWLAEAHGKPAATHRIETSAQPLPHTMEELEAELRQLEQEYGQEAVLAPAKGELPEESGG